MRDMNLQALYPKPKTTLHNPDHKIYPYLLRDLEIIRPNQAWATDITYIRMPHGFMYLVAIIDLFSRYITGWNFSNTLSADFCKEMLQEAFLKAHPEILNTDQGCQFTSAGWIDLVTSNLTNFKAQNISYFLLKLVLTKGCTINRHIWVFIRYSCSV